ncbi:MAG: B12-binding domain-containing radical SAM protein [Candidatus Bathyarchaeota archaeon]|nr:B12-binding domain-containing radical SAM protein [Candidatus Bathyarchaeota archaeon]
MKITLVNPPYPPSAHSHPAFIPLGIAYLGAVAEKAGHEVTVIDCQAEKLTVEAFSSRIVQVPSDVVGVTSTTLLYNSAKGILVAAKQAHPNVVTMMGGSHVSFWDEKALNECPSIDVVIRREGELTFIELLERIQAGKRFAGVLGITYRGADGTPIRNEDRPFLHDLDSLPFPAFHLLPLHSFHRMGKTIFPLVTSRGCVQWCDFCSTVRMFGRGYRMHSPKRVVDQIEMLHNKYGESQFTFYDDAFTINRDHTLEICADIKARKLDVEWDCETRVDAVDKELLEKMHDAGCITVWFGVESGSEKILGKMHKKINRDQVREAFKMTQKAGMMTIGSAVLGFPGESEETAWETINFINSLNPDDVGFYIATPYPGTPMYEEVKNEGWLKITDFDKYDTAHPTFETPWLSMEDLAKIRYKANQKFYLRPRYMLKMMMKGGTYGKSGLKTSAAYALRAMHIRLS